MNQRIQVSLDVTKIVKERLIKGSKGTYLDLILIPTKDSKFGDDFLVKQDIPKEDSDRGIVLPILGNARILKPKESEIPF